jgi:hypothetical protein
MCGLHPGCHGDKTPANFPPPVCSPTEAGKKRTNWFFLVICGLPKVFSVYLRLATIVYCGGQKIKIRFIKLRRIFQKS